MIFEKNWLTDGVSCDGHAISIYFNTKVAIYVMQNRR